jgi:hypothetical protein
MGENRNNPQGLCTNKRSLRSDLEIGLTVENFKFDKKHPHCVLCGRRLSSENRSSEVNNCCVDCARSLGG